jgi:uncharacterized membrane protein
MMPPLEDVDAPVRRNARISHMHQRHVEVAWGIPSIVSKERWYDAPAMNSFTTLDLVAFVWFVVAWAGFGIVVDLTRIGGPSLSRLMDVERRRWMREMADRDVRIVDTAIMTGLQNGTAFFASTSLIALGGAFTLLNQTDRMMAIFRDLPFHIAPTAGELEIKIALLVMIYGYAFFKFGWAYRLFNYAAILIGAVPAVGDPDVAARERAVERAAEMQIDAGHHFHWGLRALFFSLGLFGWFIDGRVFIVTTTFILAVLVRRQYLSKARAVLAKAMAAGDVTG